MTLSKEQKQEIIGKFKLHEGDSGSPEVQIALLTEKIQLPHRALQGPQAGPRVAARAAAHGRPAPPAAGLPQGHQGRSLSQGREGSRTAPLGARPGLPDAPARAASRPRGPPAAPPPPLPRGRRGSGRAGPAGERTGTNDGTHRTVSNSADGPSASAPARWPSWPAARPWSSSAAPSCWWPRAPPSGRVRRRTSSPSPWTTASAPTPRARSRAASSSARAGRPRRKCSRSRLIDRPIRPLFHKALPLRDADHGHRAVVGPGERRRRARADRRLRGAHALSDIPFPEPIAGVRVGRVDGAVRREPDRSPSSTRATWTWSWPAPTTTSSWSRAARREVTEADADRGARVRAWATSGSLRRAAGRADAHAAARPSGRWSRRSTTAELARRARAADRRPRALKAAIRIPGKEERQEEIDTHHGRGGGAPWASASPSKAPTSASCSTTSSATSCARWCSSEGVRADGRSADEIRPITIEVGVLPRTHGSACSPAARPRRWR